MKRTLLILLFAVTVSVVLANTTADIGKPINSNLSSEPSPTPTPALTQPCPAVINTCPLEGCGDLGDALLNRAKNRSTAGPTSSLMTLDQIKQLPQPATWDTGTTRTSIAALEGKQVTVKAYLLKAKAEGAESCNCGAKTRATTDIHLVLVSQMPDFESADEDYDALFDEAEGDSVTAEITPRLRGVHPLWVYKNINDYEGAYIVIRGWLMLDTKHIPQAHRLPNERANHGLKRATNWEIHPVTGFRWCSGTKGQCDNSNSNALWHEVGVQ